MAYDVRAMYRRHGHIALRRAEKILASDDDAQEVVQEIFTSLLERPDQFSGRSSFVTWLYAATTHRALNRLRNERRRLQILSHRSVDETSPASPEVGLLLREALASLPEQAAEVLVYFHLDRMSKVEIAEVTGSSRKQIARTLDHWMKELREQEARQ